MERIAARRGGYNGRESRRVGLNFPAHARPPHNQLRLTIIRRPSLPEGRYEAVGSPSRLTTFPPIPAPPRLRPPHTPY